MDDAAKRAALEITDPDGDTLDVSEVFGMGGRQAALFVTSAEDPNDIEGVRLFVENATKLRDWLNAFIRKGASVQPAMAWTKEPPTVPGLWWWKPSSGKVQPLMLELRGDSLIAWEHGDDVFIAVDDLAGEWHGPLPEPPA